MRIGYRETDLRERAKRLGAIWRPKHRLWELSRGDARRLGIADRVVEISRIEKLVNDHQLKLLESWNEYFRG